MTQLASVTLTTPSVLKKNDPIAQNPTLRILLVSFLSLYFELALIRWLPSEIRVLAYFTNVTLISCVLGLGIGAVLAGKKQYQPQTFFRLFSVLLVLAKVYGGIDIPFPLSSEGHFMWNGLSRQGWSVLQYPAMLLFFVVNVLLLVPIGQMLGREFQRLAPLRAYSLNVIGAVCGIASFAVFSWFQIQPVFWFLLGLFAMLTLVRVTKGVAVNFLALVIIVGIATTQPHTVWSPYYKISSTLLSLDGRTVGTEVVVNRDSHQQALDLSGKYDYSSEMKARRLIYDRPYLFGSNENVLILGAGTGNDAAAALRAGAHHVDAVEIDPAIISIGKREHPNLPYSDPRVTVHLHDARTFVRSSKLKYDKIVLGYVDSHSLFSAMSSVRLDNFIYTQEFFRELKQHLAPRGIVAVTFTVHEKWIGDRLFALVKNAFGETPVVYQGPRTSSSGVVFLGGVPLEAAQSITPIDWTPIRSTGAGSTWIYDDHQGYLSPQIFDSSTRVPSDNWPYLYLREAGVPPNYILSLLALLAFSCFAVWRATHTYQIDWFFFLLGAGFLLLETKAMTELAIFLGSTWTVNSFVICAVLVFILFANLCVARGWAPKSKIAFLLLLGTLLTSYFVPLSRLLEWESNFRNAVAVAFLCLPMFFAGLIFAQEFQKQPNSASALGANLIGAVAGGMLEYTSMAFGLKPLYLLSAAIYGASILLVAKRAKLA